MKQPLFKQLTEERLDRVAIWRKLPDLGAQAPHVPVDVALLVGVRARADRIQQLLPAEDTLGVR